MPAESLSEQWQGAATKDPSLLEKVSALENILKTIFEKNIKKIHGLSSGKVLLPKIPRFPRRCPRRIN